MNGEIEGTERAERAAGRGGRKVYVGRGCAEALGDLCWEGS